MLCIKPEGFSKYVYNNDKINYRGNTECSVAFQLFDVLNFQLAFTYCFVTTYVVTENT